MSIIRYQRIIKLLAPCGHRLYARRFYDDEAELVNKKHVELYSDLFDLNSLNTYELLTKNPSLCANSVNLDDVKASAEYYRKLNITPSDIRQRPTSLLINECTLRNRHRVMEECKFQQILLLFFAKFVTIMNKNVLMLKAHKYIDPEKDVPRCLAEILGITVRSDIGESVSLNELRRTVLNIYLKDELGMSNEDITKLWKVYSRLRHRNFQSIVKMMDILLNDIHFSKERIINNAFVLYAEPENLTRLLQEVPRIGSLEIREILLRRPKIIMQNCDTILDTIGHVKSFLIAEESISSCLEILTLSADTVYSRLVELTHISEFNVLRDNPRVLRLIHFQNKALARLDYLKKLKIKCVSLNVLSSSSEAFEKYAREGMDKTKGKDIVYYVAKACKMDVTNVRNILCRHPNWCHVPIITTKTTIDFLRYKKFTMQEMAENIVLLLYPISRIEPKLNALMEWKAESSDSNKISGVAFSAISNSKLLALCLYFIESEFHFSGDGIWDTEKPDRHDSYPTTIPDFPKTLVKLYRYGVTPSKDKQTNTN